MTVRDVKIVHRKAKKMGVKKWAYADGAGAAQAWLANELMGVATAGMSVLAGAAVGSAWGAIENATTL